MKNICKVALFCALGIFGFTVGAAVTTPVAPPAPVVATVVASVPAVETKTTTIELKNDAVVITDKTEEIKKNEVKPGEEVKTDAVKIEEVKPEVKPVEVTK